MTTTLTPPATTLPGLDPEIVARATALVPLIREHATEGAENRKISPEVVAALDESELLRIFLPARLGGLDVSMHTALETIAEVARGDGATAWVLTLLSSGTAFGATWNDQAQEEIWGADPRAKLSGTFQPTPDVKRVDGGYVISGRWPYSSGSFAATWASLGMLVEVDDPTENPVALAHIPASDFTIEDSWYVTGMKGTGSDTIVVDNAFVPDHRIQRLTGMFAGDFATSHKEDRIARVPFGSVAALILAAPQLGLARHALEIVRQSIVGKPILYTKYTQGRLSPTHQLAVADAATKINLAGLLLAQSADDVDRVVEAGVPFDLEDKARIRNNTGVIAELCKDAINLLLTAAGSGSFAEANVLSRIWRDSETAARHALVTSALGREAYGAVLLGDPEPALTSL
ncbi:oxidoreductase [Gordonia amarae]|uniref:Oxidoreductase n=2 Tax=Gordonia amarae TaxID=36821 RepID=A0A857L2Y1_9ACTN|nr:acyl-CoA dehydrogenase family protein [Gordonia amarae]MCS3876534.1 alkylation response protein AidB-like acyl-CoA dehydrogenase [Gordonia amarae]QHN19436.1 oxidoreductase [Gordonia amarae]QHN23912.1 oxidoreductase [Gordonia amarae]QHN32822.1 oxidoreductase [Gordonia amarae]QHN41541.1 oxidoreductase [Gordonia amarae]